MKPLFAFIAGCVFTGIVYTIQMQQCESAINILAEKYDKIQQRFYYDCDRKEVRRPR